MKVVSRGIFCSVRSAYTVVFSLAYFHADYLYIYYTRKQQKETVAVETIPKLNQQQQKEIKNSDQGCKYPVGPLSPLFDSPVTTF